jgi:uncharacterized protein
MRYTIVTAPNGSPGGLIARLAVGDEIHAALKALARERAIPSASLTGLGAVSDVTLALFDPVARVYRETRLVEDLEIATMTGNIAWVGDEPMVHIHGVVSRADGSTAGGHIMRGIVSVTLEVSLLVYPVRLTRKPDPEFGLNLLDLDRPVPGTSI